MPATVVSAPAALTLTLFGPMQVSIGGHPPLHLRSRKALALLALLALRPGRSVEREWLAGTLWPDADKEQASASLRPVLSELRKALGGEAVRVQSPSRNSLLLDLTGVEVDVSVFDAAVTSQKLPALERAVALYRGPLLEGSAEEWAGQERDAREQDCLRALGTLAEAARAAGDHGAAVGLFRRALGIAPGWEAARRGLMETLAGGGDGNGALQVYREFVALLRSDPKAVPDEKTSALYARLRAETRQRAGGPVGDALRPPAARTVSGNLPHPVTDLVGREDERAEVAARLRRSRLVTLTGPGGIGKTRLALAVGAESVPDHVDGVWLVALEALSDGGLLARQIASVLGLKEEFSRSCLIVVAEHLRPKRLLLVLDNCEHLLAAAAKVTGHLLRECAGVRILATSREALGITGETAWAVPALSVPDPAHLPPGQATLRRVLMGYEGIQLFVERARAVQKTFALTDGNALAVAQVCARLEGLPLAIELAAARIRAMTVGQIAARLDDRLGLLTGGSRAGQSRQQTLRATLDWSYDLLGEAERLLMARLSVFAGGWSLEAAESVCAGPGTSGEAGIEAGRVLDLLTGLVDKSLVIFETRDSEARGRYHFLEMVRQYAVERLATGGGTGPVGARQLTWYMELAERAEGQLTGPAQETWLHRLDMEHDNLRAALTAGDAGESGRRQALRLAGALWRFWNVRGYFSEGRNSLERALGRPGIPDDAAVRAKALNGAATLAYHQSDFTTARERYEESLRLFQELGDRSGSAEVLNNLGNLMNDQGDRAAAQRLHEESLRLFQGLGDRSGSAESLNCLGNVAYKSDDLASAQTFYEASLRLFQGLEDRGNAAILLGNLGNVARLRGESALARARLEEGLSIHEALGNQHGIALTLNNLADVVREQGDLGGAGALFEEALRLRRALGNKRGSALSLSGLGGLAQHRGDLEGARALFEESLHLRREIGDRKAVAVSLREMAEVLAAGGHVRKAARLWGAVQSLRENIGTPLPPAHPGRAGQQLAQAQAALGETAFAAAWEEGRAMTWEQAASYAIGDPAAS